MLSEELQAGLASHGITDFDEVSLRLALERQIETYTLVRLAPWPARRWKCHYRLLLGTQYYDAQTVPEAYALALLVVLSSASPSPS